SGAAPADPQGHGGPAPDGGIHSAPRAAPGLPARQDARYREARDLQDQRPLRALPGVHVPALRDGGRAVAAAADELSPSPQGVRPTGLNLPGPASAPR